MGKSISGRNAWSEENSSAKNSMFKTREDNVAGGEGGFGRDVEDEVSEVTWDHGGDSGSHSE